MHVTPELVALIQRERERTIEQHRLAHVVERLMACRSTTIIDRLMRAAGLAPAAC